MRFAEPLIRGRLVRRYKRFLADVMLADGTAVTAHCPNPGSMMGLAAPGAQVWLSPAAGPKRKLHFTWEMVRVGDALVGINTMRANGIVAEALTARRIPELAGYGTVRREVPYGTGSRIDLLLEAPGKPTCYVEVKSVTLKRTCGGGPGPSEMGPGEMGLAEFPDAVTKRGTKHLDELARMASAGARAVMVFVVQRGDCDRFALAADIDPGYGAAFRLARTAGIEALCYACSVNDTAIELDRPLPMADPGGEECGDPRS